MISALDTPGLNPSRGHCVVFLGKILNFHIASLHPGVHVNEHWQIARATLQKLWGGYMYLRRTTSACSIPSTGVLPVLPWTTVVTFAVLWKPELKEQCQEDLVLLYF